MSIPGTLTRPHTAYAPTSKIPLVTPTPPLAQAATLPATPLPSTSASKTSNNKKPSDINPEERYRMIAVAAYYRAEKRGFIGGDPSQDWVEAEAEVNQLISP